MRGIAGASRTVMSTVPCSVLPRYEAAIQPAVPPPRMTTDVIRLSIVDLPSVSATGHHETRAVFRGRRGGPAFDVERVAEKLLLFPGDQRHEHLRRAGPASLGQLVGVRVEAPQHEHRTGPGQPVYGIGHRLAIRS